MPVVLAGEDVRKLLSADWQIYLQCIYCGWEERLATFFIGSVYVETYLNTACRKCSRSRKQVIRHCFRFEYRCADCETLGQITTIDLYGHKCPRCLSQRLVIPAIVLDPDFPEEFGEISPLQGKEHIWGRSSSDDADMIVTGTRLTNRLPDRVLYYQHLLRFCERLRYPSKHHSDDDKAELWNCEATMLQTLFQHTDDLAIGTYAKEATEEALRLTTKPSSKALLEQNLANIYHSFIIRESPEILEHLRGLSNARAKALQLAEKALGFFGETPDYLLVSARLHHCIAAILVVAPCTQHDLEQALKHLEKTLSYKPSPQLLEQIKSTRAVIIAQMNTPTAALQQQQYCM
jgi:DNA-directed RNA polymerase subunit RPC12/RpoP